MSGELRSEGKGRGLSSGVIQGGEATGGPGPSGQRLEAEDVGRSYCPTCGQPKRESRAEQSARLAREHRAAAKGYEEAHRNYLWHAGMADYYERGATS